ncbi:MAG: amino acid ABC transporter permease [Eubacteriales bacterium]|nr:amino acid ABC transporter permease [Clostridiales bacterium]MDY2770924.1 amino acid ABC transporter permease [Eubacteriales bacterium]
MLFNVFSDAEKFSDLLKVMLTGILPTVRIFGFTILLSIPLGILLAAGRVSKVKILRMPISVYIYLIRSTPLMLQLLFSYFLLSRLEWSPVLRFLFGDKRGSFPIRCIISMFSLNYAAYFAEIFRGGIQSVPQGQREAAKVLGYSRLQSFFRVQLPQIFKNVMPSLTNEFVTLVKDTSIAKVIAVSLDNRTILHVAEKQVSGMVSLDPYIMALVFFLIFNGVVEQTCKWIERRMNYYR